MKDDEFYFQYPISNSSDYFEYKTEYNSTNFRYERYDRNSGVARKNGDHNFYEYSA